MNIFEKAVRNRYRFDSSVGLVTCEDLWDLPLQSKNKPNLDDIAISLSKTIRDADGVESFVSNKASSSAISRAKVKLEIVKHVIACKIEEKEALKQSENKRQLKAKVMEMIAKKKDESLESKSEEELMKMLEEIDG